MDRLWLWRGEERLRAYALTGFALEVGRDPGADIVVDDPGLRPRHALVVPTAGTVRVYRLDGSASARPLPPGGSWPLGRRHRLVREAASLLRDGGQTEPLPAEPPPEALVLELVAGAEARRVAVGPAPVAVGSAPDNDLVLHDAAVSAHHFRLEPASGGVRLRDLASRNRTRVDGRPMALGVVGAGCRIRAGRSELRLRRGGEASGGLIARSPAMRELLVQAERGAGLTVPALVLGESGSGKEGLARMLHEEGPRRRGPFVPLNAGALPESLAESELFGHEKGAFTGAERTRRGVFEQADGGTLFLDEVGELSLALQSRLLRVLDSWRVRRVGGEVERPVDVRLVAATHRDLPRMVERGDFRLDLLYRLRVLVLDVPPLRARPEDVVALAEHFLAQMADGLGERHLAPEARSRLLAHRWPGNVRELRNVLQRAAVGSTSEIDAEAIARALVTPPGAVSGQPHAGRLAAVVARHGGNVSAAAKALGVARSTLRDRLRRERRGGGAGPDDDPSG